MRKTTLTLVCALAAAAALTARDQADEFSTAAGPLRITPVMHASLVIEASGKHIYIDPWSKADFSGLPPADLVLITDIHGDHMDKKALADVSKPSTEIIAPKAVAEQLADKKTIVLANGETKKWGNFTIQAVPMYNEQRGPGPGKVFHDKGRGNGYVLTFGGKRIYISGDTEGTPEMKALKNIDAAFVCMNLPYTMPPEEAAEAVKAFHPKVVYPYHYRDSDVKAFESALAGTGIEVRLRKWY